MLTRLVIAAAFLAGSVSAVAGQVPDAERFARVAGVTAEAAERFFERLRVAVGTSDRPGACALVAYPLAHPDGALASASACEARYDAVFTVDIRKAIGKQIFDELFVNARGIMFGVGEVWIAGRCPAPPCGPDDIRISAINSNAADLVPLSGKVLLACRAGGQLLHVSADGSGGGEMRLWRSGRNADAPTTMLPQSDAAQRDDRCGARSWTFADGTTRFTVSTLRCDAHLAPPPMGAVGQLVVKRDGLDDVDLWCVE